MQRAAYRVSTVEGEPDDTNETLYNDQLLFLKYDSSNYLYGIITFDEIRWDSRCVPKEI